MKLLLKCGGWTDVEKLDSQQSAACMEVGYMVTYEGHDEKLQFPRHPNFSTSVLKLSVLDCRIVVDEVFKYYQENTQNNICSLVILGLRQFVEF